MENKVLQHFGTILGWKTIRNYQIHSRRGEVLTVPCGPKSFAPLEVILQAGEKNSQEDVQVRLLTGLA